MYEYATRIGMRDTDAAGVLFFARYFSIAHDAYEAFLDANGFSTARILRETDYVIPVVHAEADYRASLWLGDHTVVTLHVCELRRRAFGIHYELRNGEGALACSILTRHAVVSKTSRKAIAIPDDLRATLAEHLREGGEVS